MEGPFMLQKNENASLLCRYFSDPSMPLLHKLHWYNKLLEALLLIGEQERSKQGKRFRNSYNDHEFYSMVLEHFLPTDAQELLEDIPSKVSGKLIPFLKMHEASLQNLIYQRIMQICDQILVFQPDELDLFNNSLAFNAEVLNETSELSVPSSINQELLPKIDSVHNFAANNIIKICDNFEETLYKNEVSSIDKIWYWAIFHHNEEPIMYAWGMWRYIHLYKNLNLPEEELNSALSAIKSEEEAYKMKQVLEIIKRNKNNHKKTDSEAASCICGDCDNYDNCCSSDH